MNINHPTFVYFLNNISNNILKQIPIDGYFKLSSDKKIGMQYTIFILIKSSVRNNIKMTDEEINSFISLLCKKNESDENYELAGIFNDMIKNIDILNNLNIESKFHKNNDLVKK